MDTLKTLQELYPEIPIYEAAAFTYENQGGNMAGVVIDNKSQLNYETMQEIAKAFGYSESAFIQKSDIATFKLLFFTPKNRVKMCGHATLDAWGTMFIKGIISAGNYTQEVIDEEGNSQVLKVEVLENGSVFTNLDLPKDPENIDRNELNKYLNFGNHTLPLQIINTGFRDLMIPVNKAVFEKIDYAKIDKDLLLNIQKVFGVEGLHMFYLDKENNNLEIFAKNTDPINGIYPYDDATGTTNGALGAYLYFNKLLPLRNLEDGIFITQIGKDGKKSKVLVKMSFDEGGNIQGIKVGGEVYIVG